MPFYRLLTEQEPQTSQTNQLTKYSNRLRLMDFIVLRSIVGRARHELSEFDKGYSRSDKLRYHRRERYQYLAQIDITHQSRIQCDKCNEPIEFRELFFIQKRKSYNKYYHHSCASSLNMCF